MGHGNRRRRHNPQALTPPAGTQIIQASYAGPLPPAAQFERYEQILPGSAERIMRQWEQQSSHRQGLEATVINANIAAQTRGQWIALSISLAVAGVSAYLFAHGLHGWAFATVVSDLVALVAVNRGLGMKQRMERHDKDSKH